MNKKWITLIIFTGFLLQSCGGLPASAEPTSLPTETGAPPPATNTLVPATETPIPPSPTPAKEMISSGNVQRLIATWGFDIPDDSFRSIAFSPDGLLLAAGTGGNNDSPDQRLRVWDVATGQLLAESEKLNAIIWDVAYSPGGSYLAVGLDSGILQIRGSQDLRQIQQFYLPGPVNSLSFSPDGSKLAAGVADNGSGTVFIIDLESGENLLSFWAHPYSVGDIDYSPDGSLLATGATDRTVRVWNSSTGELLQSLPQDGQGGAVAFSHNGGLLASGYCARSENYACLEGGVLIWSTTTWDLFRDITGPGNWIEDLVFSQGDDLVIGADRYEYLHFWQVSDGVNLRSMRISSYGSYALALTHDGYSLAAASAYAVGIFEIAP